MKFRIIAATIVASVLLAISPAAAQTPSSYVLRDQLGSIFNVAVFQCPTGKICPISVSSDSAGKPLSGPVGVTNPNGSATYIQGVTGGIAVPVSVSGTASVNLAGVNGTPNSVSSPLYISPSTGASFNVVCTSGCGGGGGGGLSVPFAGPIGTNGTPIGFKDASGNLQALLGDVTNGQWVSIKASVAIPVTGTFWQATQPISGTITANLGTLNGAATAAAQTSGNASLSSIDSKSPALGQALSAASVPVVLPAAQIATLTPPAAITGFALDTSVGTTNTNLGAPGATACATDNGSCSLNALVQRTNQRITATITALGTPFQAGGSIGNTAFGISGTLPAFAATPTVNLGTIAGAATAAAQTTGNNSLSSIDGKTPALGQALAGASVPIVLTAAQITTLTPLATVTANIGTTGGLALAANQTNASQKTQIVDASGNVIASTSNNLNVQCANCSGSGVSTADQATFTAGTSLFAGSGGFFQTTATANALTTGQQGMFQVTANRALFTNLRTAAGVEIGVAAAPVQVSLANTAANATAIKVDGSAVTQPVSGTLTANLGTLNGAATAANQTLTQAPITPTTATATKSDIIGIQYNSTQATFTNGQQGSVQGTSRGALYVATGADTFSVAATLAAETTKVIGTTRNLGNAGAIIDFAGQNAASPANAWLTGCQFNTSPTTITSGNSSPVQCANDGSVLVTVKSALGIAQGASLGSLTGSLIMGSVTTSSPSYTTGQVQPASLDLAGSLRINCVTGCSASGAVDESSFTAGTSSFGAVGGFFQTTATSNALTTGQWGAWQMTAQRAGFVNLRNASGVEIGTATTALIVGGKGTAGTADAAVQTVQGIASMTPLLTNPGTPASWGIGATAAAVPANASLGGMSQGGNLTAFTGTSGNLNVQCANCSGSGVSTADQATFTAGTSLFAGAGGFFQTTATSNPLTNGQQGMWQMTANRAGFINLRTAAGAEIGISTAEVYVGGRGTAGSAAGGVLTVQGVASMTPLLTNPGTAASWGLLAIGSTTSGSVGSLAFGAVTTAAPTYTTAQSNALSLTTAGGVRTDTSSIAGAATLTGNGNTGTGSQRVTVAGDSAARAVAGEGVLGSTAPTGAQMSGVQSGANMVSMIQASASTAINVSTATTTQLVLLSGSTKIYVTSFDVIAGGTGNITFVYGTGTNCGTGTTALTGAYNLTAQAGIAKGSGMGPVLVVPAGNALCVTTSAGVQMSGSVSYTQF